MVMQNNGKKRPVWQDITPVKTRPITTTIIPKKKNQLFSKFKFPKISKKLTIIFLSVIIVIVSVSAYYLFFINKANSLSAQIPQTANDGSEVQSDTKVSDIGEAKPEFSTILPAGKTISNLGGWTLISPKGTAPAYTYTDRLNGIGINISEQILPEGFEEDTDQKIENLALGFNASQKISANGLAVYIGTSTDGPQSIIFRKNNLLILIKSDTTISNDQWVAYINSLQ